MKLLIQHSFIELLRSADVVCLAVQYSMSEYNLRGHMEPREIRAFCESPLAPLYPRLRRGMFHRMSLEIYRQIMKDGFIYPNKASEISAFVRLVISVSLPRDRETDPHHYRRYKAAVESGGFLSWLQNFRRMVDRYERKARNFYGFVQLSAIAMHIKCQF